MVIGWDESIFKPAKVGILSSRRKPPSEISPILPAASYERKPATGEMEGF
jgi:hypothetical protein